MCYMPSIVTLFRESCDYITFVNFRHDMSGYHTLRKKG